MIRKIILCVRTMRLYCMLVILLVFLFKLFFDLENLLDSDFYVYIGNLKLLFAQLKNYRQV